MTFQSDQSSGNHAAHRLTDVFGGEVHHLLVHGPLFIALHDGFLRANRQTAWWLEAAVFQRGGGGSLLTHLEVDGRHVSQLLGQWDALQDHVSPLAQVHVQLHEHAVQVLRLEHADQGAAEQLSPTDAEGQRTDGETVSFPRDGLSPTGSAGSPGSQTTRPRPDQWRSSGAAGARSDSVPLSWTGRRGGSGTPGHRRTQVELKTGCIMFDINTHRRVY